YPRDADVELIAAIGAHRDPVARRQREARLDLWPLEPTAHHRHDRPLALRPVFDEHAGPDFERHPPEVLDGNGRLALRHHSLPTIRRAPEHAGSYLAGSRS